MIEEDDQHEPRTTGRALPVAGNVPARDRYQRYCKACATWLKYRTVGPCGAPATYSYCPNTDCGQDGLDVEHVHVS